MFPAPLIGILWAMPGAILKYLVTFIGFKAKTEEKLINLKEGLDDLKVDIRDVRSDMNNSHTRMSNKIDAFQKENRDDHRQTLSLITDLLSTKETPTAKKSNIRKVK